MIKLLSTACFVLFVSVAVFAADVSETTPLIPPVHKWPQNEYCKQKKIGKSDFYVATLYGWHAPWYKMEDMHSVGLDELLVPGYINPSLFNPDVKHSEKVAKILQMSLDNQWPFHSIEYTAEKDNGKRITDEAKTKIGELWFGDSHPEYSYRLDFLLPAVRGENSTWLGGREKWRKKYFLKYATPILKEKLPFYMDKTHKWTRHEYYVLSKILQDVTYKDIGLENALPWHMAGLGFYYVASQPGNRAVADKSSKNISAAHCRGALRQFGGNKSWVCWLGYEPPRMLNYNYSMKRGGPQFQEEHGYPVSHSRLHIYLPYLSGINFYKNEKFYGMLIDDVEQDGFQELSPLGHEFKKMMDFTKRHPDRGLTYTPVALLMDWEHTKPGKGGVSYGRYFKFEDCDHMNHGLFYNLLYPELMQAPGLNYFDTAPLGDIFDVIKPNVPEKGLDAKVLENYKVLFTMGGQRFDADLVGKIKAFVEKGGSFVINVEDIKKNFGSDFTGVDLKNESITVKKTRSLVDNKTYTDKYGYTLQLITTTDDAEPLYVDEKGNPVITQHKFGKGYVFVVAAKYMIVNKGKKPVYSRLPWKHKRLVSFSEDFMRHLTAGLLPVEVVYDKNIENKVAYRVAKKGNGWVVTFINYSFDRGPVQTHKFGTSKIHEVYTREDLPVKLICNFPVQDVIEWFEDRDVEFKNVGGKTVVETNVPSGQFKVIEIQPQKIEIKPTEKYVNYALKRPVKVSSFEKGHDGDALVDGNTDRKNGWWSANISKSHHRSQRVFGLPQKALVCLEEIREIDHISVLLYYYERVRLERYGRPRYTQFLVETSLDGKEWQTVFDERKNLKTAFGDPLERWFKPHKALYVKITVTYNSMLSGAQIIEMGVYGKETEKVAVKRKPANPGKISFPIDLTKISKDKIEYLIDKEPEKRSSGWLPVGRTTKDMSGQVKLMASGTDPGKIYMKSLYGQAPSEYIYKLDGKYKHFLSVAGSGTTAEAGNTVVFKVFVDGVEVFNSGPFGLGRYPIPVYLDLTGKNELKLIIEDGGDGIRNDYAWWGDARLIK
jgi:NPCBM/NEW2 domain-containing protein/F5/8 type C domain-containing protein